MPLQLSSQPLHRSVIPCAHGAHAAPLAGAGVGCGCEGTATGAVGGYSGAGGT